MFSIKYTNKMKRDVKRISKRGKDISKLITALNLLASGIPMPEKYQDHPLKGEMKKYREFGVYKCFNPRTRTECDIRHSVL